MLHSSTSPEIGRADGVDAVFVARASLRAARVFAEFERLLGTPVTASNHAMA